MKKHLILFFAGVILSYGNIKAQTAPDKKEILKVTLQVNDYFMKKYADYRTPSFVRKVVRPSNIWTRSVYYEGLMALYSIYLTSPRASVAMLQSSKAYALLQGRDFVTPEDIKFVAPYVLQHRLILTAEAEMEGYSPVKVTQRLIDKVEVPK